jgi:hypothetical protein
MIVVIAIRGSNGDKKSGTGRYRTSISNTMPIADETADRRQLGDRCRRQAAQLSCGWSRSCVIEGKRSPAATTASRHSICCGTAGASVRSSSTFDLIELDGDDRRRDPRVFL